LDPQIAPTGRTAKGKECHASRQSAINTGKCGKGCFIRRHCGSYFNSIQVQRWIDGL
jgi:hypothetical protein